MYLRGQAQLVAHNGTAAAAEFQKFLNHRGIVLNFPLGALAHVGLARAYALQGDTTKARAAYQDFLTMPVVFWLFEWTYLAWRIEVVSQPSWIC